MKKLNLKTRSSCLRVLRHGHNARITRAIRYVSSAGIANDEGYYSYTTFTLQV